MVKPTQPPPEPPPLPQSVVIGLNRWNDKSPISNANWSNKLNEQVNINNGDSIFVKASYLDTRGTASANIDILTDTEISLTYYFYWMHTFNACNPADINDGGIDTSSNLTQQVLVGRDIQFLYDFSANINLPVYYTTDPSKNYTATGKNDADGLPYIVYQSSNSIPVAPVLGPVIPASDIVVGTTYVINTVGLTTNWQYAGVPFSTKNKLSPFTELNFTPFTATNNPDGVTVPATIPLYNNPGMSTSEFLLPADVAPVTAATYMITVLGDTDWIAIDPNYVTTFISASQMVAGTEYAIDSPGNINWVALGAANDLPDSTFVYTPPPTAPPDFDISLNNAFFLANAASYTRDAGTAFGADPSDFFECVIGVDGGGNYTLVSYTGSGLWCDNIGAGEWNLAPATFGVSTAVCPTATNLVINGFAVVPQAPIPVYDLSAGQYYIVDTTGFLDGGAPYFNWTTVGNLPTTDTTQMVAGTQYQVYEYNNVVIPYAPQLGAYTDVFISQGPIANPPGPTYSLLNYNSNAVPPLPATPNIFVTVTLILDGAGYTFTQGVINLNVTSDYQGNCIILPTTSIISDNYPFLETVTNALVIINGPAQAGYPAINVTFNAVSTNGDFSPDFTSIINFPQDIFTGLVPFPSGKPSLLVELQINDAPTSYLYNSNSPNYGGFNMTGQNEDRNTTEDYLYVTQIVTANPNGNGQFYFQPPPPSATYLDFGTGPLPPDSADYPFVLEFVGPPQPNDESFTLYFDIPTPDYFDPSSNYLARADFDPVNSVPPLFPVIFRGIAFLCSGPSPLATTSSFALPVGSTLNAATVSGVGYLQGTVYNTVPKVGSIIQSINPDPAPPSTGRAIVYPIPSSNDGTVRQVLTPSSFKLDLRPVKKTWKMNLKAGSYDPNYLAELISRNMSRQRLKRVNKVSGAPFGTQSTLNIPTDSIWNGNKDGSATAWAYANNPGQNTFYDSKNLKVYDSPPQTDYNIDPDNDDMPFLFVPAMNGSVLNTNQNTLDYVYAEIPHPNANGLNNLPAPTYYINLVPLISDVRSISPTIPPTVQSDGYYSILPFYSQNVTTTTGELVSGNSGLFPIAYGATQTSLLYNNENNGLFSFNYLHSPIFAFLSNTTNDLTEVTAHMYTTQQNTTTMKPTNFFTTLIDKNSGVLLNQMNPPSFWKQLGFDIDALTVDLDDPNKIGFQMTLNEFESRTTGGFCGSSNIFNQQFHTANSATQPSVPDTEIVYLSATPNPPTPISALTANLTIGTSYTIYNLGSFFEGVVGPYANTNWTKVGGSSSAQVGQTFVATDAGFPDPPFLNGSWNYPPPQVIVAGTNTSTTTQLQNNYFSVTNTISLNASSVATQRDNTGHYLLEITGYSSIYLDDKSKYEIKSIVSSYYIGSAGSFVSQPFPDSYNYYHYGSPISLSNIKVRILDPYTMQEAIVGPNSSVYLQINKLLTDQAVQQVEN